jgi:YggT family protein
MQFVISMIHFITGILTLIVFADVIISYFLSPFHPFRRALDAIVQPLLEPIRRVLPRVGMIDFSPFVLLILIQIVDAILVRILVGL